MAAETAWQQHARRTSLAGRLSTLFERRRAQSQTSDSARATATFEVPLFLSPARYQPPHVTQAEYLSNQVHSRTSTQSLIESVASVVDRARPFTLAPSSRYSSPAASPSLRSAPILPFHEASHTGTSQCSEQSQACVRVAKNPPRRRRRRTSVKIKIQSLRRISAVFGITLLCTLIACK